MTRPYRILKPDLKHPLAILTIYMQTCWHNNSENIMNNSAMIWTKHQKFKKRNGQEIANRHPVFAAFVTVIYKRLVTREIMLTHSP
jgi:hypothetical protein